MLSLNQFILNPCVFICTYVFLTHLGYIFSHKKLLQESWVKSEGKKHFFLATLIYLKNLEINFGLICTGVLNR